MDRRWLLFAAREEYYPPAQGAFYAGRDIERRAATYGIPALFPAPHPVKQSILANLVAVVGMHHGWGADFVANAPETKDRLMAGDDRLEGAISWCRSGQVQPLR